MKIHVSDIISVHETIPSLTINFIRHELDQSLSSIFHVLLSLPIRVRLIGYVAFRRQTRSSRSLELKRISFRQRLRLSSPKYPFSQVEKFLLKVPCLLFA